MVITIPELAEHEKPYQLKVKTTRDYYTELCKFASQKFKIGAKEDTDITPELKEAIKFLEWDLKPFEIIRFSRFMLVISLILSLSITSAFALFGYTSFIAFFFSIMTPFLIAFMITEYPKTEARFEKVEALGLAPNVLTQMVIYLKQNPNLEKALEFVTKYSTGRIINDLRRALWTTLMGHRINLKVEMGKIAQYWGQTLTELKRSLYLIISSVSEQNEVKRHQTLDRAVRISLDGIIRKIKEYTNKLYLPTLFLFSFGTVLPLVIISLLPIFSFFGQEFSSPVQIFLLLVLSLSAIYFYSNSILAQRPPTFSSIKVPETLESYPKPGHIKFKIGKHNLEVNSLYYVILIFLAISFPGILYLLSEVPGIDIYPNALGQVLSGLNTLTIIWGVGIAIAAYCYGSSWYKKKLRDSIEGLENEMVDGIYQLASRINEGRSPEETIRFISKTTPGTKFGKLMRETYDTMKSRHTTLEEAFFNDNFGSMRNIFSVNLILVIRMFMTSLKRGVTNCAQTLFTMSDHFDQLRKTEEGLKETLRNSMSMMRTTASIFAPMITGLVITLQQLIQNGLSNAQSKLSELGYDFFNLSFLKAPAFSPEVLQLITGVYMLLLAVLLIRYVVLLEYGKDEIMLKTEIAKNLPIALFIFTITLILSRIMLS
jgi:hypothetical protein